MRSYSKTFFFPTTFAWIGCTSYWDHWFYNATKEFFNGTVNRLWMTFPPVKSLNMFVFLTHIVYIPAYMSLEIFSIRMISLNLMKEKPLLGFVEVFRSRPALPSVWRGNYFNRSAALSFFLSVLLQPPPFYSPSWGQCQFQASIIDPWRAPFQARAVNPHTVNLCKIALTAEQRTGEMFYYFHFLLLLLMWVL